MSSGNVDECVEQSGNLLKNIFSFIRNCVSTSNEFEDCGGKSTSAWGSSLFHDAYLENKYKRVKIVPDPRDQSQVRAQEQNQADADEDSCDHEDVTEDTEESSESEMNAPQNSGECKKDESQTKKNEQTEQKKTSNVQCESKTAQTESTEESEDENTAQSFRKRKCSQKQRRPRKRRRKTRACERVDKQLFSIVMTVRQKTLKKKLQAIERRACALWKKYSKKLPQCRDCNVTNNHWNRLKSYEKFSFYWAIMAGEFLHETPFDNFTRFYMEENDINEECLNDRKFKENLKRFWNGLERSIKMPFIMEAFLYRVSQGKINLRDDCNIRDTLEQLYAENC